MLRLLLVLVVIHYSYYSLHWVISRITAVICYLLLLSFMMLCSNFVLPFCMKPVCCFLAPSHPSVHLGNRKWQLNKNDLLVNIT